MDFDLNDDQRAFGQSLKNALAKRLTSDRLRAVWAEGPDHGHDTWRLLGELGATAVLVPEEYDGLGADTADLIPVLEECGAAIVPEPVAESAVVAPLVLRRFGSSELCRDVLPRIAGGEFIVGVMTAPDRPVPDGLTCDALIAVIDGSTWWVPADLLQGRPLEGWDPSRRLASVEPDTSRAILISDSPECADLVLRAGAVATAGLLVGVSSHLVDVTRDYLLAREQFGVQIGSFQALKHRLADAKLQVETARSLSWYALAVLDEETPAAILAAHHAKAAASSAARQCGYASLQLHGGIGFTWENDLHLFLQRARAWEVAFGDAAAHRLAAGRMLLSASRREAISDISA
jgi:alkylation response protein AidB-like acyl-CoA dehydrogenase